jgi:IclR family transcriptional regulator, KDG regulon repressor
MSLGCNEPENPHRTSPRQTDRAVKSAERTLAVFEIFSQEQRGLRVGEVSRNLGIPQPSASMLLKNLARLGYLHHDPQRRTFSPTIRLALLGSWLNRHFTPVGGFDERLAELQAELGEPVYVGMQNGASVQYVLVQDRDSTAGLAVRSGQMQPLTSCASGQVLLSSKSDSEIRGWVRRANVEASSEHHWVQEGEFLHVIQKVRRNGFAETAGLNPALTGEVAIAIASPFENSVLSVAVGLRGGRPECRTSTVISALQRFKDACGQRETPFVAAA